MTVHSEGSGLGSSGTQVSSATRVRIDGHGHFHRCYEIGAFIRAAYRNLYAGFSQSDAEARLGCLFLAGVGGSDPLLRIDSEQHLLPDGWTVTRTSEGASLLSFDGTPRIALVGGRQVKTAERLEVLTFGSTAPVVSGKPFDSTLTQAAQNSELVIVPWALGKWRLGREARVKAALEALDDPKAAVFLGDNANRCSRFAPKALDRLAGLSRGVLPGSDSIAHPDEVERVGAFGFEVRCEVDLLAPQASIFRALRRGAPFTPFGSATSLAGFVTGQIRVRMAAGSL